MVRYIRGNAPKIEQIVLKTLKCRMIFNGMCKSRVTSISAFAIKVSINRTHKTEYSYEKEALIINLLKK